MSETKFTPGPWGWFGNNHGFYLATRHSGRRFVMSIERLGTRLAQPSFQVDGRMVAAGDLVKFEVGDGQARGFKAGKSDRTVYRYDIVGIDHPDARLIAASASMYAALRDAQMALADRKTADAKGYTERARKSVEAALAEAEGRS